MNHKQTIVHPGQRVIGTDGKVHTVAFERDGLVWVYGETAPITVSNDAWGWEHDQTQGLPFIL